MKTGYELQDCEETGQGIFATKRFHKDEVVMMGIIEHYDIDENHSHASQIGEYRYAMHAGNISKVNHSCNPNCGVQLNATGAHDFVAMTMIEVGDEITFDYAMRNYAIAYFPDRCCCGESNCRGSITGWQDLPESVKKKYAGYVAPYLLEIDRRSKRLEKNL